MKKRFKWLSLILFLSLNLCACTILPASPSNSSSAILEEVPTTSNDPYVVLNNNVPTFEQEDFTTQSFETYSDLDSLGRCGVAYANLGSDLMPTKDRESISSIKPSGWQSVKYDIVDGQYLYNRCHLIGYQLSAENANEKNLITGTRYMNVEGMLPFENMVADYIKETDNHVLYRVTPVFEGNNLVANGVQIEAESVEDMGEGISFNVYVYNQQPGIEIDYTTGQSNAANTTSDHEINQDYILNINTHKFHLPDCESVKNIKKQNKQSYTGTRQDLINQGYEPCSNCQP